MSELLQTHTRDLFERAVERAVELLRSGGVVALPTETVYGLAANAFDARAVERVFEIKGRPAHNPVILHVASLEMARGCVRDWPTAADALARGFWPGPLTLVLPCSDRVPGIVTAGGDTVGVRWPSHPLIQAVIRSCGFPLAAPSANRSGSISPTNASHVRASLGGRVPLIVDGGQSQVGIESTVLDVTSVPARVLRPGMIHRESLLAVLNAVEETPMAAGPSDRLRSPGQLLKHYAPRARLLVLSWEDESDLIRQLTERGVDSARAEILAHARIPAGERFGGVSVIPHDAEAFARALYGELHRCDETGAGWIVVERPPETVDWRAISDRLWRASQD